VSYDDEGLYTPWELNAMTLDERKAALDSEFGRSFHESAFQYVTWIFWARDTEEPTDILNHASAFMLDREGGLLNSDAKCNPSRH
jgi:hypothetical protein